MHPTPSLESPAPRDSVAPGRGTVPPEVQDALRKAQDRRDAQDADRAHRWRALRRRTVVEATVLFAFFETLLTYFEPGRAAAGLVAGAALGALWNTLGAGRFVCLATGLAAHALFRTAFGWGDAFTALFGALAFACLAAGIGTGRESRRRDV